MPPLSPPPPWPSRPSQSVVHRGPSRTRCGKRERLRVRRLGRRPFGTPSQLVAAVVAAAREAEAQPRLEPDALKELKQALGDKEWRQHASEDIEQYLKERGDLQRMRSSIERAETLGMDAEDVEDLRQQEARHVVQCRELEVGKATLHQLRTAAGKVTAKRLAGGADGCRELLVLTPSGEELREMVMSCDDASLEQLQDRALELLNTLHRETARRVGALLDGVGGVYGQR